MAARLPALVFLVSLAIVVACKKTPTSATETPATSSTPTLTPTLTPSLGSCAAWANQQRATGVPPATPAVSPYRQALYDAGGGIKAVGSKYYGAYFPSGFASTRRVLVALHGTGGSPELQFNDWHTQVESRNWGYLGLKYLDDSSGEFDNEVTIYSNLKLMVDDLRASCDLGSAALFLVGFSRGSAQSFPVAYLDLKERRLFAGIGNNSGSWDPGGDPPPTLAALTSGGDRSALTGLKFWMYCGELDFVQGFSMCTGMAGASEFVQTYGATVATLYRDPAGAHGGLTHNQDAMSKMFAYFETLR